MNSSEDGNATTSLDDDYIFDRADVRAVFITLYSIVFCCCFFGNLVVILVVTLSRRLRSITNFFLANLAVADLCVGVFCVFQNLYLYLNSENWVLGSTLCKMYHFVPSLSYTASILILVVICTERYVAIIHPIACKQILTPNRLVLVVVVVWCLSAGYSVPRLHWMSMVSINNTTLCLPNVKDYNMNVFDIVNLVLLYLLPLSVMSVLYSLIAHELWQSSLGLETRPSPPSVESNASFRIRFSRRPPIESHVSISQQHDHTSRNNHQGTVVRATSVKGATLSSSSQNVLRARRGVIRMLIVVVLVFALCNLPFHARKMWQWYSPDFRGPSDFSAMLTPLTFLVTYANSGINPLLYAFMSRNFRKGMRELLCSPLLGVAASHPAKHHPTSSILRRSSTRSTTRACTVTANQHS